MLGDDRRDHSHAWQRRRNLADVAAQLTDGRVRCVEVGRAPDGGDVAGQRRDACRYLMPVPAGLLELGDSGCDALGGGVRVGRDLVEQLADVLDAPRVRLGLKTSGGPPLEVGLVNSERAAGSPRLVASSRPSSTWPTCGGLQAPQSRRLISARRPWANWYCGVPGDNRALDLGDIRGSRRNKLPPQARVWVERVCGDAEYEMLRAVRDPFTHRRIRRLFTVPSHDGHEGRTTFRIPPSETTTVGGARHLILLARDVSRCHVQEFFVRIEARCIDP
jgi:hypothetical protein